VADGGNHWWMVSRNTRKRVMGQPIRGFKSHLHRHCDVSGHRSQVSRDIVLFSGLWLVVPAGVEGEGPQ